MIISTEGWEKDEDGWSVAPAGLSWIKEGYRVVIGNKVSIGEDVTINNRVILDNGVIIGDRVKIGKRVIMNNCVKIGCGANIGDDAVIRDNVAISNYAKFVKSFGFADGYEKHLYNVNAVAYIQAGCRWFTLSDAIKHWGNHSDDRNETLYLMVSAITSATELGLKLG